jgi:hypothetical protein
LRLNNGWNPQFGGAILLILFPEAVGCILLSGFNQFVKRHLLFPKSLHVLLDHVGNSAQHPAGFTIFAQLALLRLFIMLILTNLPIILS